MVTACRYCITRTNVDCDGLCPRCRRQVAQMMIRGANKRMPTASPTDALPGSEAKLRVLARRAECGEHLFHPDDVTYRGVTEITYGDIESLVA